VENCGFIHKCKESPVKKRLNSPLPIKGRFSGWGGRVGGGKGL